MAKVSKTTSNNLLKTTLGLGLLAGILLVITNSAIWVNRYIFNTDNFSSVVTTSLTSESSRQAIAQGVADRALADRPVLQKVAGDVPVRIISGLLGTTQASNAVDTVVSKLQVAVTSNNQESIAIDLSGIKSTVTQLVDVASNLGREPRVNPDNIPSEIVLIDKDDIPDFYRIGVAFLWIAPLALIGALAALAYPYIKNRGEYKTILAIQGACVAAAGLLALLVGPLFRPPLLANIERAAGRAVVGNLYDAFIATFATQSWYVIGLGVLMLVLGGGLSLYAVTKKR